MGMDLCCYYFLRILERNGKLEIGWGLLKLFGSAPGFFNIGVIVAVLKGVGTIPVVSEEWRISLMRESREGRQYLTRTVGV